MVTVLPGFFVTVQIIQSINDQFGRAIWRKVIITLSHGNLTQPPPGTTFGKHSICAMVVRMTATLRGAHTKQGLAVDS